MDSGFDSEAGRAERFSEIDLRGIWAVLVRKRAYIIVPVCAAFLLTALIVNLVTPRYTAETEVLLENQENFFTRPQNDQVPGDGGLLVDPEAVSSQIQVITSRDLAHRAIKALGLEGNPEFDPIAKGIGPVKRVLILLGIVRDPTRMPPEDRILEAFQERLTVFSPTKTRVLTIDFQSRDPELASRAANKIAELYLSEQSDAKRERAKAAAESLRALISELRAKLSDASAQVEEFRSNSGLLAGANNMTITGQQLAELNSELSKARTSQADAQAKASLIRDKIRQGRISEVPDVANNDLVRRIAEQRVTARAQLASDLRTLLPGHPHIKELTAQVADLDAALRAAAEQTTRALENEARIAGNRVANLEAVLNQQKKTAGVANSDEIRLHELERIADAYRDQLAGSTTKYQAALAREDSPATPADARIISRAVTPDDPSFPKKTPLIIFASLAALIGSAGWIVAAELLSGRAFVGGGQAPRVARPMVEPAPVFAPSAEFMDPPFQRQAAAEPPEDRRTTVVRKAADLAAEITARSNDGIGICIVTTGLAREDLELGLEIALGRQLAQEGHAIILDLDGHPANFAPLFSNAREDEHSSETLRGLTDLLSGEASFAEVICRDRFSRLHYIPAGTGENFDFGDFDIVLEALSQTYDFILLMAPPLVRNEIAAIVAAYADFVIISKGEGAASKVDQVKSSMLDAGARNVRVVNILELMPAAARHVA